MAEQTTAEHVDPWDDEVDLESQDRGDMLEGDEKPEAKAEEEETPEAKAEEGEEKPEGKAKEEDVELSDGKTDTPEAEAEEEPEAEETPAPSPYMVPKHRYDTAKERAAAAERRALELEQALAERNTQPATQQETTQQQTDYEAHLTDLDKQHAKALADGEYETAAQLASQARQVEREMYRSEMQNMTYQATTAARESSKLDQAIDVAYAKFPTLDPDSGQFDQDKTDEVLRLQGAFSAAGYSHAEALYEAVKYAFNEPEQVAAPETAAPTPEKRKTDVKKNVEAANSQPPDLKAVGNDSSSAGLTETLPDITQLTDEEFDALPASKLRLLRGDAL